MPDTVIVGAGTAGCILAARLTEDPRAGVLLLEAGGTDRRLEVRIPAAFSRLFGSGRDWGYRTAPQTSLAGREVLYPRGKGLGGSSSTNAMMVIRGHRVDHAQWPAGWGWADVEPFYDRAADGPFAVAALPDPSPLTEAFLDAANGAGSPARRASATRISKARARPRSRSSADVAGASSTGTSHRHGGGPGWRS